jgi:MoaE-MoaD fusion protein
MLLMSEILSERNNLSADPIWIKILFFATLKDRIGQKSIESQLPGTINVSGLRDWLAKQYPDAAPLIKSCLVSVNKNFAGEQDLIRDGAEVAFFPPVSGGDSFEQSEFPTILLITQDPIDLDKLVESITLPTTGAACLFTGMVRGKTSRGMEFETTSLEYEAYEPMAHKKLAQVAFEIRQKWPTVEGIVIVQRIGRLAAGTPTVLIACSAAHRDTGVFDAARYGIDRLKQIVPVWKKEIGPDGEMWIEGDYHPQSNE